ncbi:MAG: hypothetical protein H6Q64_2347 [Firmicutes bacterium]|nr:hypothetical protein [Bacillota bacterium]
MWEIYDELIDAIPEDLTVTEYMIGLHWTIVGCEKGIGMAKTLKGGKSGEELRYIVGMPLKKLASHVKSWNMLNASLGLAAINSTLNTSEKVWEITEPSDFDKDESSVGEGNVFANNDLSQMYKKVAFVGHIPKLEELKNMCELSVLDRNPQPGDYPDSACEFILPEQELIYITGTAFINKTMPRLLELSRHAKLILLGPSVPISPVLFQYGVDAIAGMIVANKELIWQTVQEGGNKNIYENGGQRVYISR